MEPFDPTAMQARMDDNYLALPDILATYEACRADLAAALAHIAEVERERDEYKRLYTTTVDKFFADCQQQIEQAYANCRRANDITNARAEALEQENQRLREYVKQFHPKVGHDLKA